MKNQCIAEIRSIYVAPLIENNLNNICSFHLAKIKLIDQYKQKIIELENITPKQFFKKEMP